MPGSAVFLWGTPTEDVRTDSACSGDMVRTGGASEIEMSGGWSYKAFSNKAKDIKLTY